MGSLFESVVGRWSTERPADLAVESLDGGGLSYGELAAAVTREASRLVSDGVRPGDRVLLVFPNTPPLIVSSLAVSSIGAIAVHVPATASRDRLDFIAGDVEPTACLHDPSIAPPDLAPDRRLRAGAAAEVDPDLPAMILYSSGSTGRPKGVLSSHRALATHARNLAAAYRFRSDHRDLILGDLAHSGGWQRVTSTLSIGGTVVLAPRSHDLRDVLDLLPRARISGCFLPPVVLRFLLREPSALAAAIAKVRTIELGTSRVRPAELEKLLEAERLDPFLFYGLTECSRATILDARSRPDKLHTVGRPSPGVTIEIKDGEIWVRGPQQTLGFWRRPELDAERFRSGFVATGDYGRLDEDGFLVLLGRRDELISSGSHHFFPEEVELELGVIPGVDEYLIAGVEHPMLEQVPWAFVVLSTERPASTEEISRRAAERLPSYMVPRRIVIVPAIARGENGKPSRKRMVERYGASMHQHS